MVVQQFDEKNRNLAVKEGKNASVGLAGWCVSNCPTYYSGREDFVEKLKKYIPINIYGSSAWMITETAWGWLTEHIKCGL